jgi:predicted transcriptional regulator
VSYAVLQSCITQLLMRQWLTQIEQENGQKKLATTDKGMVFLDKWFELQQLSGISKRKKPVVPLPSLSAVKIVCR